MEAIRNLDITDPAAKYAVAALLGATLAELKTIDKAIVGSSKNITAAKPDLNRIFQPGTTDGSVVQQPVPLQPFLPQNPPPVPVLTQQPVPNTAPEQEDPNQLVFDFNKPITPEVINNKLDIIIEKLNNVVEILKNH